MRGSTQCHCLPKYNTIQVIAACYSGGTVIGRRRSAIIDRRFFPLSLCVVCFNRHCTPQTPGTPSS